MNEPIKELQDKIDELDLQIKNTTQEDIARMMHFEACINTLDLFVKLAYKKDPITAKKDFTEWKNKNFHYLSEILYLVDAVEYILMTMSIQQRKIESLEINVENEFYKNLEKYLPTAEKVDVKMNQLHRPDGFVRYEGNILPVEVKREAVTKTTIFQIQRYIEEYKSVGGIVVAPELKTALPSNVKYIKVLMPKVKRRSRQKGRLFWKNILGWGFRDES